MRRRQAFTLIELAVVALILAIAASLAVPRLGGGGLLGRRLRSAATRLAVFMDRARDRAVSFHRTHYVVLRLRTGQYDLLGAAEPDGPLETVASGRLPEGVRFETARLAGQIGVLGDEVRLAFAPEGWMDDATIVLADEKGDAFTVAVSNAEGRVEVSEGRIGVPGLTGSGRR